MPNWTPIVYAQWLGYYGTKGALTFYVFEEAMVKIRPAEYGMRQG